MFTKYLLLKEKTELFFSLLKMSNFVIECSVDWLLKIIMVYVLSTLSYLVKYWLGK